MKAARQQPNKIERRERTAPSPRQAPVVEIEIEIEREKMEEKRAAEGVCGGNNNG